MSGPFGGNSRKSREGRRFTFQRARRRQENSKIEEILLAAPSLSGPQMHGKSHANGSRLESNVRTVPSSIAVILLKGKYLSSQITDIRSKYFDETYWAAGNRFPGLKRSRSADQPSRGTSILVTGGLTGSIGRKMCRRFDRRLFAKQACFIIGIQAGKKRTLQDRTGPSGTSTSGFLLDNGAGNLRPSATCCRRRKSFRYQRHQNPPIYPPRRAPTSTFPDDGKIAHCLLLGKKQPFVGNV